MRGAAGKRPALGLGGDKEKFLVKCWFQETCRVWGGVCAVANALRRPIRQVDQRPTALRGVRGRYVRWDSKVASFFKSAADGEPGRGRKDP